MTEPKLYTTDEVEQLLRDHTEHLETKHFEEKTEEVLKEINRRLNEANGYKATIGKDIKSALTRLDAIETRFKAEDDAAAETKKERIERRAWYQEERGFWIALIFGLCTVAWEILNIYQSAGGTALHHVG